MCDCDKGRCKKCGAPVCPQCGKYEEPAPIYVPVYPRPWYPWPYIYSPQTVWWGTTTGDVPTISAGGTSTNIEWTNNTMLSSGTQISYT